jgi:hypothetical protein
MLLGDICIDFGTDIFQKGFCECYILCFLSVTDFECILPDDYLIEPVHTVFRRILLLPIMLKLIVSPFHVYTNECRKVDLYGWFCSN